jgi:hypothetical protein
LLLLLPLLWLCTAQPRLLSPGVKQQGRGPPRLCLAGLHTLQPQGQQQQQQQDLVVAVAVVAFLVLF